MKTQENVTVTYFDHTDVLFKSVNKDAKKINRRDLTIASCIELEQAELAIYVDQKGNRALLKSRY
jgi:hypothetical protein